MTDDHQRSRPVSYYLRPSYLDDYTQLLIWNDVNEAEIECYELGVALDKSKLHGWSVDMPEKPILIEFPRSYFTCTGHRSIVVRTNLHQPWVVDITLRSLNGNRHQDPVAKCHLAAQYEANYDGRFLDNDHTDKIPRLPHFSMKSMDEDVESPNLFPHMHNLNWPEFCSIESMLDGWGRAHYQITRVRDGKVVKPYNRSASTERHLPYTSQRVKDKVSGLSYTKLYNCCKTNYELHRLADILIYFEFYGSRITMKTKTRQQLRRVEMSTGEKFAPRPENGYWIW